MDKIRNFCIIAHVDHGKSTLADRILEITGAVDKRTMKDKDRVLDTLELEQERGITIKLQNAKMSYLGFELNLIDTPGHVDFSYEVSRSLAACEGCLLLIDATQGIQAQTLSVFYAAMEMNLTIIPVINKIDLPSAQVEQTKEEIVYTLGFNQDDIVCVSGKTGEGVLELLDKLIAVVPPPTKNQFYKPEDDRLQALVFDSFFHDHKGAIALVRVFNGKLTAKSDLFFMGSSTHVTPIEIGYLRPSLEVTDTLNTGEVGYIATGLKDLHSIHSGDTVVGFVGDSSKFPAALPGYQPAKSMVYASLFPVDTDEFTTFSECLEKLALNDAALTYQKVSSPALGSGFICGYLGLLHMEITQERLEREFGLDLITTTPSVEYKLKLKNIDYQVSPSHTVTDIVRDSIQTIIGTNVEDYDEHGNLVVKTVSKYPDQVYIEDVLEPFAKLEIITPEDYIGGIMQLISEKRGEYLGMEYINQVGAKKHVILRYDIPTNEIITDFFSRLKSISQGYASMDYTFKEFKKSDIVKVSILVNHEICDPLSFLSHSESAVEKSRKLTEKLKELIPRQQFPVPIQAAIGAKFIARETIQAYRKDVLAGMSGGHVDRKKKLLEAQKKGKDRLKRFGSVEVPKEAFLAVLKN